MLACTISMSFLLELSLADDICLRCNKLLSDRLHGIGLGACLMPLLGGVVPQHRIYFQPQAGQQRAAKADGEEVL